MYSEKFMMRALAIAATASHDTGTAPYGAVIVKDDQIVGEGLNHANALSDPTSHGEVEAIRDACKNLGSLNLSGAQIYTSCEPCPLCVTAIKMTGISEMYYSASLDDSARIISGVRSGDKVNVAISDLRCEAGSSIDDRSIPVFQKRRDEGVQLLETFAKNTLSDR